MSDTVAGVDDVVPRSSSAGAHVGPSRTLFAAIGVAILGALLLVCGDLMPVVHGAAPGFFSGPLLVVLAVAPVAVACGFMRANWLAAAGVLAGAAALVPGRFVLDLQFAIDSSAASRPELYLPTDLDGPGPGAGLWLLLAGHVCSSVAGVLAIRTLGKRAEPTSAPDGRRWLIAAVFLAVSAGVGLVMSPFASQDPYLLARNAFESPVGTLAGLLLLAGLLPLAAAVALGSRVLESARGCLLGLAVGVVVVALPNLVAGASMPGVQVTAGPILSLLAAIGLSCLAIWAARPEPERDHVSARVRTGQQSTLPGRRRLQLSAGALGVLTALAAVAGSLSAQLVAVGGRAAPDSPAMPLLLLAGLVVGVLALLLFVPNVAASVRPALSVAVGGVLFAGTAVLGTAVVAAQLGGMFSAGIGVLWTSMALLGAVLSATCSVVAGMVERDEDEDADTDGPRPGPSIITPLVAGTILTVAGFGAPVIVAPDYTAPGLWSNFATPSVGLLVATLIVLGAAALAVRSRPARACALLLGVAGVLLLRAGQAPLTSGNIIGASAGPGVWFALAGAVAMVVAAGLAAGAHRTRHRASDER